MGTQSGSKLGLLIRASEFMLWHFEVFPYVCIGKPYACNVSAHALREWVWSCAHMYVTTFTLFALNSNVGSLLDFMALLCMQLYCSLIPRPYIALLCDIYVYCSQSN